MSQSLISTLRGPGRTLLRCAAIALGTYGLAFASLTLLGDRRMLPLWAPNALALALLLDAPLRRWPRIIAAAASGNLLATLAVGDGPAQALVLTLLNIAEYAGCAALLRWREPGGFELTRTPHLIRFIAFAGLLCPFAAALLADWLLPLTGRSHVQVNLLAWTMGDALGLLILTPAFLTFAHLRQRLEERPLTPQGMLSLGALVLLSTLVFGQDRYPLMFLVLPALLWVSLELEVVGAALGVILAGATAIVFTRQGEGPIAVMPGGMFAQAIEMQLFLGAAVLLSITVAAQRAQRRRLQAESAAALALAQDQTLRARMAEEVAGVAYWRMDALTRDVSWSQQMFRMFDLPPEPGPDLKAAMLRVHPDDRADCNLRMERSLKTGQGWSGDVARVIHRDGQVRFITGRAISERDEDGRIVGVFGTLADITEQTLAEAALAESERRYRLLAENANDLILHADIDGVITYASPAAAALVGYEPEALIGLNWCRHIDPQDRRLIRKRGSKARGSTAGASRSQCLEYRVMHKDGRVVWVQSCPSFVVDPTTGQPCGVTDVIRDISERKVLEAELTRALADAESAAAVKTEFLANMSHELRTPITAVLGFSALLEQEVGLSPDARRYVERVAGASKALLSTVNDILDFSKLEAGQVEIRRRPDSPAAPAREALELFGAQAAAKGIALELEGVELLPERLQVDVDRLRQMLLNLVGNAVKFTEQGSVRMQASYDVANRRLSYAVIDTGPGLTPEQIERLFQRFSQIDASSTRRHTGAGLGLAICKGLAETMGGEIGVESAPRRGSRFWFWVTAEPAEAEHEGGAAGEGGAPALPRACRVLLADDNPANRDLARCLLEPFGARIKDAVDGLQAVELAASEAFDVILMDVRMPVMDGPEALKRIRRGRGPNRSTPVLAFSADVGSAGAPDFRAMGFDGEIGKPLTAADLIGAVASSLAQGASKPQRPRRAG